MNRLQKQVVPPENIPRLHPISVNSRLEENSPAYGKRMQSNILKIHRLTQSSLVPSVRLLERAGQNQPIPNAELAEQLSVAVQLGGAACTRELMLLRDVVRDGLPPELKQLASRRQPVTDKAFGDGVEEEYSKMVADRKDRAYFSSTNHSENRSGKNFGSTTEPFLAAGGRGPSAQAKNQGSHSMIQQLTSSLSNFFKEQEKTQSGQKKQRSWAPKGSTKDNGGGKKKDDQGQNKNRYYRD